MSTDYTFTNRNVEDMIDMIDDLTTACTIALAFGERAGLAAMAELGGDVRNDVSAIHPEGGVIVSCSPNVTRILALAQSDVLTLREHGALSRNPNRINEYDFNRSSDGPGDGIDDELAKAIERLDDEAAEVDMGEVTPGNTETVYRDQPIPERK